QPHRPQNRRTRPPHRRRDPHILVLNQPQRPPERQPVQRARPRIPPFGRKMPPLAQTIVSRSPLHGHATCPSTPRRRAPATCRSLAGPRSKHAHASSAKLTASFAPAAIPNSSISRNRAVGSSSPSHRLSVPFFAPPPHSTTSSTAGRPRRPGRNWP